MVYQNLNLVRLPISPRPHPVNTTGSGAIAGDSETRKRQDAVSDGTKWDAESPQNSPHSVSGAFASVTANSANNHGDPCRAATVPVITAGLANNGPTDTPLNSGEQIGKWSHFFDRGCV